MKLRTTWWRSKVATVVPTRCWCKWRESTVVCAGLAEKKCSKLDPLFRNRSFRQVLPSPTRPHNDYESAGISASCYKPTGWETYMGYKELDVSTKAISYEINFPLLRITSVLERDKMNLIIDTSYMWRGNKLLRMYRSEQGVTPQEETRRKKIRVTKRARERIIHTVDYVWIIYSESQSMWDFTSHSQHISTHSAATITTSLWPTARRSLTVWNIVNRWLDPSTPEDSELATV